MISELQQEREKIVPEVVKKVTGDVEMLENGLSDFTDYNFVRLTNLYLYASYCYYGRSRPVMSDGLFDQLCKYLHENFDVLEMMGVWHVGSVIVEGNLAAGTCLGIEYPDMVIMVGDALIS